MKFLKIAGLSLLVAGFAVVSTGCDIDVNENNDLFDKAPIVQE